MLVFGKPIGSGIPGATYGCHRRSRPAHRRTHPSRRYAMSAASAARSPATRLSLAAMRATLEHILTPAAFAQMIPLANRFADGVAAEIPEPSCPGTSRAWAAAPNITFARNAAAQRRRIRRRRRLRTRALPASLRPESRRPPHALPQHGADVPRHHRRRHRSTHQSVLSGSP